MIGRNRRGSALLLVLVFTMALAALAMSAIYLTTSATVLGKSYEKERDFRYGAEAALAIGRSRLSNDATILPSSGYTTLLSNAAVVGADGDTVSGVTVNVYIGPTGATSGKAGKFASVVAEARDGIGSRFVRRLELREDLYSYYGSLTDNETFTRSGLPTITHTYSGAESVFGAVRSNDSIRVASTGATFYDAVRTAKSVRGSTYASFRKGVLVAQKSVLMPTDASLSGIAAAASTSQTSFTAPSGSTGPTSLKARLEFVAVDLDNDGDVTDSDEGFVRFYSLGIGSVAWLRGDYNTLDNSDFNCGDFHTIHGESQFFSVATHYTGSWLADTLVASGWTSSAADVEVKQKGQYVLTASGSRCYLGGDPHLVANDRSTNYRKGGTDTTFTGSGIRGTWTAYTGTPDPRLVTKVGATAAQYLIPITSLNPNFTGAIYVNGSVGISGTLRGRATVYSTGSIVILDDLRYATDPGSATHLADCADGLTLVADADVVIGDNSPNRLNDVKSSAATVWAYLDDTPYIDLHAFIIARNTSFYLENYNLTSAGRASSGANCGGTASGRGCLNLAGGVSQAQYGPLADATYPGFGLVKRMSYDMCGTTNPPPYTPATGEFQENRFYELDPARFKVDSLFYRLQTHP